MTRDRFSHLVRETLRTMPRATERYNALEELLLQMGCRTSRNEEDRRALRNTLVEILEQHHLEQLYLRLQERLAFVQRIRARGGSMRFEPFLRDILPLVGLWMAAVGMPPTVLMAMSPGDIAADATAPEERHPTYDPTYDAGRDHEE